MVQTIIGVAIGVITSLIAGVILLWKGDQIVKFLQYLPYKRRVTLYTKAYIIAIRSYPYRYLHMLSLTIVSMIVFSTFISYILITVLMFKIKYSQTAVLNSGKLFSWLPGVNYALEHTFTNPWVFLFLTLTFGFIGGTIIFKTIPVELLVPYMYRELSRLRECVCKCSTKKQFLEYTDAEHNVKTLEDLRKLLIRAKTILGDVDLLLADDILKGISESAPGIQNQNGNNSVVQTATTTNL